MQLKAEIKMLRDRAADLSKKSPMAIATNPGVIIDLVQDTFAVMDSMAERLDALAALQVAA